MIQFFQYEDVDNWAKEHYGWSHFNWTLKTGANYHILRTGCYPYMKYHCTKRPIQDLTFDDKFFRFIKVANLGLPCLFYGIAAKFLIKHVEYVTVPGYENPVPLYFLYEEDKGAEY